MKRFSLYDESGYGYRCRGYKTHEAALSALQQHWGRWFPDNKIWKIVDHMDNSVSFIMNPHYKRDEI